MFLQKTKKLYEQDGRKITTNDGKKISSLKGNYAVVLASLFYSKKGYSISLPLTDTQQYDLIAEKNGKCNKIQVKYLGVHHNNKKVKFSGRKNDKGVKNLKVFYDELFIVVNKNDKKIISEICYRINKNNLGKMIKSKKYHIYISKNLDKYIVN